MRTKAGKLAVQPSTSNQHSPSNKNASARQQQSYQISQAMPGSEVKTMQATNIMTQKIASHQATTTTMGVSQQGIKARPMSGTQSQGSLQPQIAAKSHRKSTSMGNKLEPSAAKQQKVHQGVMIQSRLQQQYQQLGASANDRRRFQGNIVVQDGSSGIGAIQPQNPSNQTAKDEEVKIVAAAPATNTANVSESAMRQRPTQQGCLNINSSLPAAATAQQNHTNNNAPPLPLPTVPRLGKRRSSQRVGGSSNSQKVQMQLHPEKKQLTPSNKHFAAVTRGGGPLEHPQQQPNSTQPQKAQSTSTASNYAFHSVNSKTTSKHGAPGANSGSRNATGIGKPSATGMSATLKTTSATSHGNNQHVKLTKSQQQTSSKQKRQKVLTPNSLSKGLADATSSSQQRRAALYEQDDNHKLQHEIEASDDAPYKPGLNGFIIHHNSNQNNQNKNSPEAPISIMMDSRSHHYNHHGQQQRSRPAGGGEGGLRLLASTRHHQQEHHFATEGNDQLLLIDNSRSGHQQAPSSGGGGQQQQFLEPHQQIVTTTTSGNEDDGQTTMTTAHNAYATENQKIEYVTKSYSGSAWCCQSSETQYDQSQIDTTKKPITQASIQQPRQLTFRERVVEMIGWGSCTKATPANREQTLTLIDEDSKIAEQEESKFNTGNNIQLRDGARSNTPSDGLQTTPQQPFTPRSILLLSSNSNHKNAATGAGTTASRSPMPKLKLTQPPIISPISIMPRTRRQQLGLTPQTNMRLFKCDDQVGRKSILSNQSILPCSEDDSFISSGVKGTSEPPSSSFTATKTNTEQPAAALRPSSSSLIVAQQLNSEESKHQQLQKPMNYPQNYPQSSAQNLSQYNAAKEAMMKQASLQEERKKRHDNRQQTQDGSKQQNAMAGASKQKQLCSLTVDYQSTHSYDYKSSIKTISEPRDAGSIIENLHALNVNIQKRKNELALRDSMNNSVEELERQRLAAIKAETNSVTSQIPACESDSGGLSSSAYQQPPYDNEQLHLVDQAQKQQQQLEHPPNEAIVGEAMLATAPRSLIQNQANKRPISVNFESVIMLENKLIRICKSLLMVKYAEEKATYQYTTERQLHHAIQNYQIQHEELIGLCEEYWTILRQEAYLFCQIPQRMFKDKPRLVAEIRKAFVLKLLVVSQVGFLTSNEEFQFNDGLMRDQMTCVCQSFLCFMRVLLGKLTPAMLQNFFWARKLKEIVQQKLQFLDAEQQQQQQSSKQQKNGDQRRRPEIAVQLSTSQAANELAKINALTAEHLRSMFEEMESVRQDEELRDNSKYEHPIFQTVQEILVAMQEDEISFKDASTLIGRSLVSEFSELDSNESVCGDEAVNNMRRNEAAGGQPMNQHVKSPFLPPLRGAKEYTLVLDLDETLVHYYEEKNMVLIRPYASEFLERMAAFYEVVIFTAGTKDYADWALDKIPSHAAHYYIDHRLYRDHTIQCMDVFIKDLSSLGRNLDKTIIVDNITENFLLQPDNGISIKSWFDDPDDTALLDLAPLLRQIVEQKVPDVRLALKESKDQLISAIASGEVNPTQRLNQLSFSDRSDNVSSRHHQSEIDEANAGAPAATSSNQQEI